MVKLTILKTRQTPLEPGESYDPAVDDKPKPPQPIRPIAGFGELKPVDDTLRDKLTELVAMAPWLQNERSNYDFAGKLVGLGEFFPALGAATAASDTYDAYKRGDKWGMGVGALGTGLNLLGAKAGGLVGQMREPFLNPSFLKPYGIR